MEVLRVEYQREWEASRSGWERWRGWEREIEGEWEKRKNKNINERIFKWSCEKRKKKEKKKEECLIFGIL